MLSHLNDFIINLIGQMGYTGIFILMFFESVLIPIPSEVTMIYAGWNAQLGRFDWALVILVGALANLTGSILCYYIGYSIHEEKLRQLVGKYGKFILMSAADFDKAHKWTIKHQNAVSFFSRLMPGVRTIISLPCGIVRVNFIRFCSYTFIGALIWCTLLTYIGYKVGQHSEQVEHFFTLFKGAIIAAVILLLGFYIWNKTRKKDKSY